MRKIQTAFMGFYFDKDRIMTYNQSIEIYAADTYGSAVIIETTGGLHGKIKGIFYKYAYDFEGKSAAEAQQAY